MTVALLKKLRVGGTSGSNPFCSSRESGELSVPKRRSPICRCDTSSLSGQSFDQHAEQHGHTHMLTLKRHGSHNLAIHLAMRVSGGIVSTGESYQDAEENLKNILRSQEPDLQPTSQ